MYFKSITGYDDKHKNKCKVSQISAQIDECFIGP